MLTELDDRDQLLVTLYYRRGQTQARIGERLGYSQVHVSRLLRRAVDRLKLSLPRKLRDHRAVVYSMRP